MRRVRIRTCKRNTLQAADETGEGMLRDEGAHEGETGAEDSDGGFDEGPVD